MAGYSQKPLYLKLGMKPGQKWRIFHEPEDYYTFLGNPKDMIFTDEGQDLDGIHFFTIDLKTLEHAVQSLKAMIRKNGMIWISWYKKSSKIPTDVTEDLIRATILPLGLVDVKVCAVNDVWSGLKLVWRKENR
jgi:hypothetical protein